MTMYVWLKLLAFGFAFLDTEVFVTGSDLTTTGAFIQTSPVTTVTPATTTAMTTPKPPCDKIYKDISVNYKYDNNNKSFTAELNVNDGVLCDLKDCKSMLQGLPGCSNYTVKLSHGSCTDPPKTLKLDVPPEPGKLKLVNSTSKEAANTSISLYWDREIPFACDEKKFTYTFQCGNLISKETEPKFKDLEPKTRYSCKSEVFYNGHLYTNDSISIETDFGTPERPQNLSCYSESAEKGVIIWKSPQGRFTPNGFVLCHEPNSGQNCFFLDENQTKYNLGNLKPFTKYDVLLYAFVTAKVRRNGNASKCEFQTPAGFPTKVQKVSVMQMGDNSISVKCEQPKDINGPNNGSYYLEVRTGGSLMEKKDDKECKFYLQNLYYSTAYEFKIYFYNGVHPGDPVTKYQSTSYNSKALIAFLAFLIIVTSIALLIVLYKIYDLHKRRSR